jgi:hypothetical protein
MNRLVWFIICALVGLWLLAEGLSVPAHLRAVDACVLELAGKRTPDVVGHGLELAGQQKLGAAQLFAEVAKSQNLAGRDKLVAGVAALSVAHPDWQVWGGAEPRLEELLGAEAPSPEPGAASWQPFTDFIVREQQREKALAFLRNSTNSAVQELLRCRELTNTVMFPPSASASGQAFDAAVAIAGLLLEDGRLSEWMRGTLLKAAAEANHGGSSQPMELALLDLTSLGQRFNWGQLCRLVGRIKDTETLRVLADQVRSSETLAPAVFAEVELSGEPSEVAKYLRNFTRTGPQDLAASLRYGAGGVAELLHRNERLNRGAFRENIRQIPLFGGLLAAPEKCSLRWPWFALTMKWLLYLAGGFLLAAAAHFARPAPTELEKPLEVRGFHLAREVLFALGFLLVMLLLSEPFLAQESQKAEAPLRLGWPAVGRLVLVGNPNVHATIMKHENYQLSLLTMLLFFVLQALIFTACLVKLAEIKRQRVPPRVKLKLLENEDHLFDAGLYLGLAGTIVSLILASLGIFQFSLMAAYSSTSFGIVFVCIFKIFYLRPSRRALLLEAETTPEPAAPRTAAPALATTS